MENGRSITANCVALVVPFVVDTIATSAISSVVILALIIDKVWLENILYVNRTFMLLNLFIAVFILTELRLLGIALITKGVVPFFIP